MHKVCEFVTQCWALRNYHSILFTKAIIIVLNFLNSYGPSCLLTGVESMKCLSTFLVKGEGCLGHPDGQNISGFQTN